MQCNIGLVSGTRCREPGHYFYCWMNPQVPPVSLCDSRLDFEYVLSHTHGYELSRSVYLSISPWPTLKPMFSNLAIFRPLSCRRTQREGGTSPLPALHEYVMH